MFYTDIDGALTSRGGDRAKFPRIGAFEVYLTGK
jgi:hypothetical protein